MRHSKLQTELHDIEICIHNAASQNEQERARSTKQLEEKRSDLQSIQVGLPFAGCNRTMFLRSSCKLTEFSLCRMLSGFSNPILQLQNNNRHQRQQCEPLPSIAAVLLLRHAVL